MWLQYTSGLELIVLSRNKETSTSKCSRYTGFALPQIFQFVYEERQYLEFCECIFRLAALAKPASTCLSFPQSSEHGL